MEKKLWNILLIYTILVLAFVIAVTIKFFSLWRDYTKLEHRVNILEQPDYFEETGNYSVIISDSNFPHGYGVSEPGPFYLIWDVENAIIYCDDFKGNRYPADAYVYVDTEGKMRWTHDNSLVDADMINPILDSATSGVFGSMDSLSYNQIDGIKFDKFWTPDGYRDTTILISKW